VAGALGLTLVAGTATSVQAGLLDALFGGGARAYAPPAYDYPPPPFAGRQGSNYYYLEEAPRPRRRSVEERAPKAADPNVDAPPLLQTASCCKNGEDPMKALLNDDTLVRGDVVMTTAGLRTFVGSRAPHSMRDFVPVGRSTMISSTQKKQLLALDR
jgi:hypothetical protein